MWFIAKPGDGRTHGLTPSPGKYIINAIHDWKSQRTITLYIMAMALQLLAKNKRSQFCETEHKARELSLLWHIIGNILLDSSRKKATRTGKAANN